MREWTQGDIVFSVVTRQKGIVLATSSDNMVNCRFFKGDGDMYAQWVYPYEIYKENTKELSAGFICGEGEAVK